MVVKTEICAFSEMRIYPGHGIRFIKVIASYYYYYIIIIYLVVILVVLV